MITERLTQIRTAKQMSQRELADTVGISQPAYQYIESGKKQPSLFVATNIAKTLGVSLDYLVGLKDNEV